MSGGGACGLLQGVFGCWEQGEGVRKGSGAQERPYLQDTQNKQTWEKEAVQEEEYSGHVIPINPVHAF